MFFCGIFATLNIIDIQKQNRHKKVFISMLLALALSANSCA